MGFWIDKECWWYFTFGCGQPHAGHYVKFYGTYSEARQKMTEQYGLEWAFQYSEEEWREWVRRCTQGGTLWMVETELK